MDERIRSKDRATKIRKFVLNEQLADVRVVGAVPAKKTSTPSTGAGATDASGTSSSSKGGTGTGKAPGGSSKTGAAADLVGSSPGGTGSGAAASSSSSSAAATAASMAAIASATAIDVGGFPKMIVAADHVTQLTIETCRCCHLQEFLPHLLDWELCHSTLINPKDGYIVANPVHALHLSSQFEHDYGDVVTTTTTSKSTVKSSTATASQKGQKHSQTSTQIQQQQQKSSSSAAVVSSSASHPANIQQPLWYGEEQQRKSALSTEGVVESWCPLDGYSSVIHDDTSVEKMDKMPTLQYYRPDLVTRKKQHHQSTSTSSLKILAKSSKKSSAVAAAAGATASRAKDPSTQSATSITSSSNEKQQEEEKTKAESRSDGGDVKPENSKSMPSSMEVEPTPNNREDQQHAKDAGIDDEYFKKANFNKRYSSNVVTGEDNEGTAAWPVPTTTKDTEIKNSNRAEDKQGDDKLPQSNEKNEHEKDEGIKKEDKEGDHGLELIPMEVDDDAAAVPEITKSSSPSKLSFTCKDISSADAIDSEDNAVKDNENDNTGEGADADQTLRVAKQEDEPMLSETASEVAPSQNNDEKVSGSNVPPVGRSKGGFEKKSSKAHDPSKEDEEKPEHVASTSRSTVTKTGDDNRISVDAEDDKALPSPQNKEENTAEMADDRKDTLIEDNTQKVETDQWNKEESSNKISLDHLHPEIRGSEKNSDPKNGSFLNDEKKNDDAEDAAQMSISVKSDSETISGVDTVEPKLNEMATAAGDVETTVSSSQAPKVSSPTKKSASDARMVRLHGEEEKIRVLRKTLKPRRIRPKRATPASNDGPQSKKRKKDVDIISKLTSGWHPSKVKVLNTQQGEEWLAASNFVTETVEGWMNRFRQSQEEYWRDRQKVQQQSHGAANYGSFCLDSDSSMVSKHNPRNGRVFSGDEIMQCLQCSFIGCGPFSICRGTQNEMMQHMLRSGHKFAVTCGERSQIFCIGCGDFVYHEVFEQERFRIQLCRQIPWMAWNPNPIVRSVDAFQFLKTQEHGIVWRGLVASYPPLVPKEHLLAAEMMVRRLSILKGKVNEKWLLTSPKSMKLAASQCLLDPMDICRIASPIGLYNLGNTCFMSAILQCLIFCEPLQRYFLHEAGHSHYSCKVYRESEDAALSRSLNVEKGASAHKSSSKAKDMNSKAGQSAICLACEMDRFCLSYLGNTIGEDLNLTLGDACRNLIPPGISGIIPPISKTSKTTIVKKGSPIDIANILTNVWQCGEMKHLAGYDQRDAHEFLSAFLAEIGKDIVKYRERVYKSITITGDDNAYLPKQNQEEEGEVDF
jgi:hypothetical protein